MRTSTRLLRTGLLALVAALFLSACGSSPEETVTDSTSSESDVADTPEGDEAVDSEPAADEGISSSDSEPDIVVEATTTTVAEVAETPTTTEAEQIVIPEAGPGLGAFAVQVFQTGELGLTETEQGCIDGRLQSEIRADRTVDFDTLSLDDQAVAIEILLDCAGGRLEPEFLNSFDSDALNEFGEGEEIGRCVFRELSADDEDQPLALRAIVAVTADEPAPEETIEAGSRMFARCFDLAGLLLTEFTSDPAMADIIDADCLTGAVDEDLTADLFGAVFRDPDAGVVPDSFSVVVDCMQFGQLMAAQFASTVTFSEAEISCIDDVFRTDTVFQAMVNDEDLPDEALNGMFDCLEPATLEALGG